MVRRRSACFLAAFVPVVAIACAKFGAGDEPTSPPDGGTDGAIDAATGTPDAAPDADLVGFCAGRTDRGTVSAFCDDFDRPGAIEDGWLREGTNGDVGLAPTMDPKDARSPPRAVYVRLPASTGTPASVYGRLRKPVEVTTAVHRIRVQYDLRIDALTMIGATNFIVPGIVAFRGATCDAGERPRQAYLVLFDNEAQLALLGFKQACGGTNDTEGISTTPKLASATLAQSGWHHVSFVIADTPCVGGSGLGSIELRVDDAVACFSTFDRPFEAGQFVDFSLGVSAGKLPRAGDSRFYFDNASLDFD